MPFEKGGKVDVTSAAKEPDERIDRVTGRPYDAQAGEADPKGAGLVIDA